MLTDDLCLLEIPEEETIDIARVNQDIDIIKAELAEVDVTADFSTNIYRVKATITVSQYAAALTAGEASITMYTSSKTQYAWIYETYPDTELTFDIALCNWNCKGYKVCVLAVYTPDGARLYNTLNFNA